MGSEIVEVRRVNGKKVVIYGCWDDDTLENEYDFYDLYVDGECINLGFPFWEYPTDDDILDTLSSQ